MKPQDYVLTQEELKSRVAWGSSNKLIKIGATNEKRIIASIVGNYSKFRNNLQSYIVHAANQRDKFNNIQAMKNIWLLLDHKEALKGVRLNVLKDYLIERCGVELTEDGKDIQRAKDKDGVDRPVDWEFISKHSWWNTVPKGADMSKYEYEAIAAKVEVLFKFINGKEVKPDVRERVEHKMERMLGLEVAA